MLRKITLPEGTFWYVMSAMDADDTSLQQALSQPKQQLWLSQNPRTRFYLSADHRLLFKFVIDKHAPQQFVHWLGRDVIDKRLCRQHDSRKEYASNRKLVSVGHAVVPTFGYGIALNPLNSWGSVHVMAWLSDCISGQVYYDRYASENARKWLAERLAHSVTTLAKSGYYHDDLTLANVMINVHDKKFVWVDTRIKRLPKQEKQQQAWLLAQADATCLPDDLREWYKQGLIDQIFSRPHF